MVDQSTLRMFSSSEQRVASNYVRERAAGEIIGDSFNIYRKNFAIIFAVYFFSAFLWEFIYEILKATDSAPRGRWFVKGLAVLMPFIAGVQLTSVVAQIYLGYELNPSKIFRRPDLMTRAVLTGILVMILFPIYPLSMFAVPVVVLENVWGFTALKRSFRLGSNYYLRNFLIFIWPYTAYLLVALIFQVWKVFFSGGFSTTQMIVIVGVKEAVYSLLTPLAIITTVLLYFDMRIRNEAYDIVSLAEELRE